ncbi:hypothetical protein L226DRAFT_491585 [Lentinus tigrinus ALCF2SS1-7]|uniref:Uncharacterized protein n=1 Tax=Lentinus tigrinus ALCF2SS1-6 TaxID=1328759 RepID=A0A5C2RZK2_9APHY|nr:hypothetical protein L227DRAFT_531941 [Lentinus tigrinus ALCF2SS1-6]RPD71448.1 hypothetical protein L226DRAFT_491585 [Lentinus tigrinus ALCF2SS1-7]
MDPNTQHMPSTPSSSRKRERENETPSQRHKREKAAERQRRKRERDRQAGLQNILALSQQQVQQLPPPPVEVQQPPPVQPPQPQPVQPEYKGEDLSPEEAAKRERIRAAARERQRKHRALVKARKLRELGLDMGNDIMPALDEYGRMNPDGQYPPVMPHELPPHPHPQAHPMHEPPFPQGQPLGGQTFASTLLLSFSCAPLLKQHLLRTLSMTNEELASLEPIIAQAWDHWDQQRRMHYAQAQHAPPKAPDGAPLPDPNAPYNAMAEHVAQGHPYVHDPAQANDFRARFHRPLVAPSPFRSSIVPGSAPQEGAAQPQMSASAPPGGPSAPTANGTEPPPPNQPAIDPQLGQARDEAAGVAGKLERS